MKVEVECYAGHRADDDGVYILRHNEKSDAWSLDAYRHDDTR